MAGELLGEGEPPLLDSGLITVFLRGKKPLLLAAKRGFFPLKLPYLPQNPHIMYWQVKIDVFITRSDILFSCMLSRRGTAFDNESCP